MTRVLACTLFLSTLMFAQVIDPTTRTVTTSNFLVTWNTGVDTEAITTFEWMGNPNMTQTDELNACVSGSYAQYFGNAVAPPDPQSGGKMLVGGGTVTPPGTVPWFGQTLVFGTAQITINSKSSTCAPSSAGVNVQTTYRFAGPTDPDINYLEVQRVFDFTATAFNYDFRPYLPRLSIQPGYNEVLYPSTSGTLTAINSLSCTEGCTAPVIPAGASLLGMPWDSAEAWFAMHDPATMQGVVVKTVRSTDPQGRPIAEQLWVDYDSGPPPTNASSALFLSPVGGFTRGLVSETTTLCFYNSAIWTPSMIPPAGCRNDAAHLTPSTLIFAAQPVGVASAPQVAVLSNIGTHGVLITSIVAGGDYLAVSNCPETLPVGSSCDIAVSFEPLAPGIRSGFVDIDIPGQNEHLSLAGLGLAAE